MLSVIIPVYNEKDTVRTIIDRVRELPIETELIVVDDKSTNGSREIVQELDYPNLQVIVQPRNLQKGNSVKKGIQAARGEYTVIQDADLEYDPQDLPRLLEKNRQPGVLAVFGSRLLGAREQERKLPVSAFSVGRNALTTWYRLLYGNKMTDIATCYKMAPTAVLQALNLRCEGFDLDFELAAKLTKLARQRGEQVVEVPISYHPRTVAEGKKIRWSDGIRALWALTKFRFTE